ncbi:hypothetical protein B0H11DRAFT_1719298 [Mycena galericulata]|nr:hypothetical protein B0H11DRAFT_1719298 [Mycena galericulata]
MGTTQAIANHIDPTNSSQNGFPVSSNTLALCGDKKPQPMRPKNQRVRNACTNCRKACKKCDEHRPCLRCVKYNITHECVDGVQRRTGQKRGPYKKKDRNGQLNT